MNFALGYLVFGSAVRSQSVAQVEEGLWPIDGGVARRAKARNRANALTRACTFLLVHVDVVPFAHEYHDEVFSEY